MQESTRHLINSLMSSARRSSKVEAIIRERVTAGVCVACGKDKLYQDGNCRACNSDFEHDLSMIDEEADKVEFIQQQIKRGLRLYPYEVRRFKRRKSIFTQAG
jgi:predicted RNA-binding Zn-ribbon protein involved in translation (DUF1610 family)